MVCLKLNGKWKMGAEAGEPEEELRTKEDKMGRDRMEMRERRK